MNKLAVSIVNFNSGEYLTRCLMSLNEIRDEVAMEIYVIDNNSTDDSLGRAKKEYPKINYVQNKENVGFGKANNLILRKVKTDFILILNPDVKIGSGVLPKLIEYLDNNSGAGAITCKIVLESGKVDLTAHRGFPTPWASFWYAFFKSDRFYHLTYKDLNTVHEVDAISGAFFLSRKDILEKVNYFDEDYFMYGEDIDLCYKIKEAGFKIIYYPEVEITHYKGISTGLKRHSQDLTTADLETKLRSINAFYTAMRIFYKKHYEKVHPFFINWLVYLGINIKWMQAKKRLLV